MNLIKICTKSEIQILVNSSIMFKFTLLTFIQNEKLWHDALLDL